MSVRKMAQFLINHGSKPGARMGHLTLAVGGGESTDDTSKVYPTPAFFVHTLGGSVPHITAEVLEYVFPEGEQLAKPPLQISIDSTITSSEAVGNFGHGIASFVGLKDFPVMLTIHNPLIPLRTGYNDKFGVALWARTGRRTVNPKSFEKIVCDYKPTVFQGLSDYDVSPESTVKRVRKSTQRAIEYLEEITKSGQNKGLFVTIESAWFTVDENEATKTVVSMLEKLEHIEGFVLNGFSASPVKVSKDDGKAKPIEVQNINFELLQKVLSKLPADKPRFVPGPFSPNQILQLVIQGVDLFDSSYLTKMADSGDVFVLDQLQEHDYLKKFIPQQVNEDLAARGELNTKVDSEKLLGSLFSLKDKRFFNDFAPISKSCSCYTCRKHTRSYINHLYATEELLGPVLLMIHNLTAFSQFFHVIRESVRQESENSPGEVKVETIQKVLAY